MMQNTDDRLAERIRWLEEENKRLEGRLRAANLEMQRIHKQVLLAKAAEKKQPVRPAAHATPSTSALRLSSGPACHPRPAKWSCRISTSLWRRGTRSPSAGTIRPGPWWSGWRRKEDRHVRRTDTAPARGAAGAERATAGSGCAGVTKESAELLERRWIPVEERLPELDELVLVIASGKPKENITLDNAMELATLYSDGWCLEMCPEWTGATVTYWMPLPEPPEEER